MCMEKYRYMTYIYIKIVLSQPINPVLPDIPLPDPLEFIKKEEKTVKTYSVDEIEKATFRILKRLSVDTTQTEPVKGLVIGNVQSGKTANMAGLMAMAADCGWNMFIHGHRPDNDPESCAAHRPAYTQSRYSDSRSPRCERCSFPPADPRPQAAVSIP